MPYNGQAYSVVSPYLSDRNKVGTEHQTTGLQQLVKAGAECTICHVCAQHERGTLVVKDWKNSKNANLFSKPQTTSELLS